MTDCERVVNRLKRLIKTAHHDARDFVYVTVGTAGVIVRLLEEQERIRLFEDESGKITPLNTPTNVRCKDCKHRPQKPNYDDYDGFDLEFPDRRCPCQCEDGFYSWYPNDDWFCANGEAR